MSTPRKHPLTEEKKRQQEEAEEKKRRLAEEKKRQQEEAEEKKRRLAEEKKRRQAEIEEKKRLEAEEKKRRQAEAEEKKRLEAEEKKRRQAELEEKKRLEAEEKKRRLAEAEEKKRLEAEEKKRRQDEADEKKRQEAEEKRRQQEEAEEKKRRQAEKFKNFFVKINSPRTPQTLPAMQNARFQPFQIKEGMRLAPIQVRRALSTAEYDALLRPAADSDAEQCSDYLTALRSLKGRQRRNITRKEVFAVDENGISLKVKLLQFFENIRPPYYGTWRKQSSTVNARRPFAQDAILNYEYDSDQDWEEEPSDAEECKSDDEEELEKDEEDGDNDGFFVEHGYLSSGEGSGDEEADDAVAADKNAVAHPAKSANVAKRRRSVETDEQRKHRMAQRAEEWKESQKMKANRYKKPSVCPATVFGPSWSDSDDEIVQVDDDDQMSAVNRSNDSAPAATVPSSKRKSQPLPPSLRPVRQMRAIVFAYDQLVPSSQPPATDDGKENVLTTSRKPKRKASKTVLSTN